MVKSRGEFCLVGLCSCFVIPSHNSGIMKVKVRSDKLVVLAALRRIEIERRKKEMSPRQLKLERKERKRLRSLCKGFFDEEAEESDGECDSDEDDYFERIRTLQPLDSLGKPYMVPVNKFRKNPRFFRVSSDEYDVLLPVEKKIVRRRVRLYHKLLTSKY